MYLNLKTLFATLVVLTNSLFIPNFAYAGRVATAEQALAAYAREEISPEEAARQIQGLTRAEKLQVLGRMQLNLARVQRDIDLAITRADEIGSNDVDINRGAIIVGGSSLAAFGIGVNALFGNATGLVGRNFNRNSAIAALAVVSIGYFGYRRYQVGSERVESSQPYRATIAQANQLRRNYRRMELAVINLKNSI